MYPSGYTPDTPSGVVTPVAMTKSDSGEPIKKEMLQDYPCGSEPGHSFRSSPLNIYAIGRDSAVVLYVEGGCPNFTWESDNEWATFGTAETAVRYNTLTSSADEGQSTIVTVTDANGLEVTISVPYSGASACCEDPDLPLAKDTPWNEVEDSKNWPGEVVLFISGGCPPYDWVSDDAENFPLDYAATNSKRNRVHGTSSGDFGVRVTDHCDECVSFGYEFTPNQHWKFCPTDSLTLVVRHGKTDIAWTFDGTHSGWSVETPTEDLDALVRTSGATTESVTLEATDDCGDEVTKTLLLSCAPKEVTQEFKQISGASADKLDICNISGTLYVGVSDDKNIRTFTIDSTTGLVSDELASRAFTANVVNDAKVVLVSEGESSSVIAVAWGEITQGLVATFTITHATGAISAAIDSGQFWNGYTSDLDFIYVREDEVFGIAYCGGTSSYYQQGWFTCVGIDSEGNLATDFEGDHLFTEQFYGATSNGHHLCQGISMCKGTAYDQDVALVFEITDTNEGRIQTWDVSTGGIGAAVESDLQLAAVVSNPDIAAISENNDGYVVIYEIVPASSGQIKVYSQDADNAITLEDTANLGETRFPTIVHMQEDCFATCWAAGSKWRFTTYLIDTLSDYDIRGMCILTTVAADVTINAQIIRCSDSIVAALCYATGTPGGLGVTSIKQYCQTL